ncbi:AraC family transcriptional regulator [Flavobacterium subsaxonicum]|uniref:AraC family transcriptional regulator n=1 Tax=Flavobacterium subsaxonicum WB 4.1-42 = DSM 21790 TaxID=1121898 RepID=A0A0A2MF25_9FLAO|nr:AraC family transcriptional regulator [Flavobacterium subsaxonicum]KGO91282.1 AraC family transcriptional regulator [Flavobacterium subsaxonicum WB 4.1-42 = DSM 21790]
MKTLKPSFESIEPSFGSSFTYAKYVQNANIRSHVWHYHPEVELVFVNGGTGKRQIGSHISYYTDGDLILIGTNLPHCGFTDDLTNNKDEVVIQMKPHFLGEAFMALPETKNIQSLFTRARGGIAFGPDTRKAFGEKMEAMAGQLPFERLLTMIEVLNGLEQAADYKVLNAEGFALETQVQDNDRINMVFNYVKDNFKEPIALEDIAERASMTVPSFCRYFKKMTRKTFVHFVNEYRVVHACKLLAEKPISIADVSYESGFNNFSHFNKSFKEVTGKSASQYRQELKAIIK